MSNPIPLDNTCNLSHFIFRMQRKSGWEKIREEAQLESRPANDFSMDLIINKSKGKQKRHEMHYQCIPIINHHWHSSTSTGSAEEVNAARWSQVWLNSGMFIYTTAVAFLHWCVLQMFIVVLTEWKEHLDEQYDTFHWKNLILLPGVRL